MSGLKEKLAKEQEKRYRTVKAIGGAKLPFRQMMYELEKATVESRLLKNARSRPAITLNHNQLSTVCRLALDGVEDNTYDFNDKFVEVDGDYNNLENLHKIFSPAGNMIIGHKVLKDYCNEYLSGTERIHLKRSYAQLKMDIDKVMNSESFEYWKDEITQLEKSHGVYDKSQKQAPVLYNIEEIGVLYPELAALGREMALFKKEHPNQKITNHKTMKTAAFKKFLKELEKI